MADREITDCLVKVRAMVDLAHPEKASQSNALLFVTILLVYIV